MNRIWGIAVGAALVLSGPCLAANKDPLLDHMTGHWVLTGAIDGQQTTHDVEAVWILQNTYVRLTEVSREKDASGKPQYEAEVLVGYDAAKQRYVCFWYDITAVAAPDSGGGVAQRQGNSLPFLFKIGGTSFHTTFTWQPAADSWTWTMDGEDQGKPVPFARVTLKKAP
jgi:hypothetical protein